jgi:uracil-DNA glycosylase
MVNIGNDWDDILRLEWDKPYYRELRRFLKTEYSSRTIYPDMHDIFNALRYTAYKDVKAVILGQDPYHGPGQAHGLCFSVKPGMGAPPSLVNIFKELAREYPVVFTAPRDGCLARWTQRGVLLLNAVLTVRAGQPNSHKNKGWENFTDKVIEQLNDREEPVVFMLWGANARAKKDIITNPRHLVLEAPHPSPFSVHNGFFGCRHFIKTNDFLKANGREPIDWRLV